MFLYISDDYNAQITTLLTALGCSQSDVRYHMM